MLVIVRVEVVYLKLSTSPFERRAVLLARWLAVAGRPEQIMTSFLQGHGRQSENSHDGDTDSEDDAAKG